MMNEGKNGERQQTFIERTTKTDQQIQKEIDIREKNTRKNSRRTKRQNKKAKVEVARGAERKSQRK